MIEKKGTNDEALLIQESYAPGVKGKLKPTQSGDQGPAQLAADRAAGDQDRQGALAAEADPGRPPEAPRRRPGRGQGDLRARRGAPRGIQHLHHGRGGRRARSPTRPSRRATSRGGDDEARLLARLRLARLHHRAARLDGARRRAARDRAGRTRPRQLLRRRRHRRAQPGARRHAQRPHLRPRPADRAGDDEHLLDLPGRPVGVPAAARRRLRLPRPHQRGAQRPGPRLREGQGRLHQQELPLAAGRGLRPRPARRAGRSGRSPACGSAPSTAATSSAPRTGSATTSTPTATSTWRR